MLKSLITSVALAALSIAASATANAESAGPLSINLPLEGWTVVAQKTGSLIYDFQNPVTKEVKEPPKRSAGIRVADVAQLVDKLKNEAKVI